MQNPDSSGVVRGRLSVILVGNIERIVVERDHSPLEAMPILRFTVVVPPIAAPLAPHPTNSIDCVECAFRFITFRGNLAPLEPCSFQGAHRKKGAEQFRCDVGHQCSSHDDSSNRIHGGKAAKPPKGRDIAVADGGCSHEAEVQAVPEADLPAVCSTQGSTSETLGKMHDQGEEHGQSEPRGQDGSRGSQDCLRFHGLSSRSLAYRQSAQQ